MPSQHRARALLGLTLLGLVTALGFPGQVLADHGVPMADCMAPPPLEEAVNTADIVLVGTVTESANESRWVTVSIEEVWRGAGDPGALVQIKGGPGPGTGSSIDRTFEQGQRYIFFPYIEADAQPLPGVVAGGLADNSCTSTQLWDDAMAALRPADARTGEVDMSGDVMAIDLGSIVVIGGAVLLLVAVMLGVGLLARGRSD